MDYLCDRTLLSMIYPTGAQMLLNKCHEFKKYTQLATLFEFKSSLCCIAGIIFHTFSFSQPAFKENCSISSVVFLFIALWQRSAGCCIRRMPRKCIFYIELHVLKLHFLHGHVLCVMVKFRIYLFIYLFSGCLII